MFNKKLIKNNFKNQALGYQETIEIPVNVDIEIQKQFIGDDEVDSVNARDLHKFLKVKTQFNDWINRRIRDYGFKMNLDFYSFLSKSSGGRPQIEYIISINMAKEFSMVERNERGRQARKYFIKCEKIAQKKKRTDQISLPDFTNPVVAARAWADELEQKQIACVQRDHAVATKAWINNKKTATAMNTASQLSKQNQELRAQVGNSKTWKQARAIPWLKEYFSLDRTAYIQIGKYLSKLSKALGYETRSIDHSKYDAVKTYHAEIVEHFKHKLIEDRNLLKKYRKY